MDKKRKGTIILGTPRSGSTLLRRLIDAHPNVCCPAETGVFTACGRFLRQHQIAENVPVGVLSGMAFAGVPETETLARLRELAFGLFTEVCDRQDAERWVSKTPHDIFYIDEIEQLCADHCNFIYLVRHGADVACSMVELNDKLGVHLPETHNYIRQHSAPLDAMAHLWIDATKRAERFARANSANTLRITYEELVESPRDTMSKVFDLLGQTTDGWSVDEALSGRENLGLGDWKTYQKDQIDAASVGRWKKLSDITQIRLAGILNPTLRMTEYEELPTRLAATDPEVRRRHEIGLLLQSSQAITT